MDENQKTNEQSSAPAPLLQGVENLQAHRLPPSLPTKKVALGGWLLFYFVLTCLNLGVSVLSLFINVITGNFSLLQLLLTGIFSILPSLMLVYLITQRNIKFKYWFYFQSVLYFIGTLIAIVGLGAVLAFADQIETLLLELSSTSLPGISAELLSVLALVTIVFSLVGVGIQIAWWVYFNKSRRVAYTFDPKNNPPQ